jgi:hypothetical protein
MSTRQTLAMTALFIALACTTHVAYAQMGDDARTTDLRLDFAVPESPAFKIIDDEPSAILRPSDVREVALEAANLLFSKGILPDKYAVEIAPFMLAHGDGLTAGTYDALPFLYRTRISFASRRESEGASATVASIGMRFTIVNDGDPRTDRAFRGKLAEFARSITALQSGAATTAPTEGVTITEVSHFVAEIEAARAAFKDSSWNATIVEAGWAVRGRSENDALGGIVGDGIGFWASGGTGFDTRSIHLLAGLNSRIERSAAGTLDQVGGAAALRLYVGATAMKMLAEGEGKFSSLAAPLFKLSIAAEVALTNGFWLDAGLGYEDGASAPARFVPRMHLRWAPDEKDADELSTR